MNNKNYNAALMAALHEYESIESEWMAQLESFGIAFESRHAHTRAVEEVRDRLKEKGARFMNGGASVSAGPISSACVACTGDCGSRTFFLSLQCNRSCYFCFNVNQEDYEENLRLKPASAWQSEVDGYLNAPVKPTHAALTGGEPLLHKKEAVEFFERIHENAPQVHLRLYTAGDFLDAETAEALVAAGLQEMRLSVKLGEGEAADAQAIDEALKVLARVRDIIPDCMVEMPVIPGTERAMKTLMQGMADLGLFGINLLEFCFPYGDWSEYESRGFKVKNPAFEVLYDYGYAGGLPIAGSELACLNLLEWALDSRLNLGVHYCSLDNKNRDQILQLARECPADSQLYELNEGDYFYHCLKVFGPDVPRVRAVLSSLRIPFEEDAEEQSLSVHPRHAALLKGAQVAESFMVPQEYEGTWYLRELALKVR